MKFWKQSIILFLIGSLCLLSAYGVVRQQEDLSGQLIRFHVVANSDSAEDQAVKLQVRDRMLAEIGQQTWTDREEAAVWLRAHLDQLQAAGQTALSDEQTLRVTLVEEWFPTREYDTFSLPAGKYLSLRAEIGDAAGHNWWCVVYPSLCAAPSVGADSGLTAAQVALITEDTPAVTVKFKLLEAISALHTFFEDT